MLVGYFIRSAILNQVCHYLFNVKFDLYSFELSYLLKTLQRKVNRNDLPAWHAEVEVLSTLSIRTKNGILWSVHFSNYRKHANKRTFKIHINSTALYKTNNDILKIVPSCDDLTTSIISLPGEKVRNASNTIAMGISFKGLANTLYPIYWAS